MAIQLYKWLSGFSGASFAVASYDFEIDPTYKSAGFGLDRFIWVIRNWEYIIGILILVLIIVLLVYWWRKR